MHKNKRKQRIENETYLVNNKQITNHLPCTNGATWPSSKAITLMFV